MSAQSRCLRLAVAVLALDVAAGACGQVRRPSADARSESPRSQAGQAAGLHEGSGMVLDDGDSSPEFCLGAVAASLPPQCEGIPLSGWDWSQVEGEESASDTTWGDYHVVGSYDGQTLAVVEAGPPRQEEPENSDSIGTPCSEPPGGWTRTDADRASDEDVATVQAQVSREPDFAGLWIDYYNEPAGGPTEEEPGDIILNVAFTGDLERHERDVRELWGGPLCITQHRYAVRELQKIQRTFPADEFDLQTLWSDIDVVEGFVEIGVVAIEAETLQKIEDRYGKGVVRIDARLQPVD